MRNEERGVKSLEWASVNMDRSVQVDDVCL